MRPILQRNLGDNRSSCSLTSVYTEFQASLTTLRASGKTLGDFKNWRAHEDMDELARKVLE